MLSWNSVTKVPFRLEVEETFEEVRRTEARDAARGACGDVVTLTMDVSHKTLAPVRCQDHHQGRRGRRWHRLDGFLTVADAASVSQDQET